MNSNNPSLGEWMKASVHTVDNSYRVLVDNGVVMRGWTVAYTHWLESNRVDVYQLQRGEWVNVNGLRSLAAVRAGLRRGTYKFVVNNGALY